METTPSTFTVGMVRNRIPVGRRAYIEAAMAMKDSEPKYTDLSGVSYSDERAVPLSSIKRAVYALAESHAAGTLEPPLPEGLATIFRDMVLFAEDFHDRSRFHLQSPETDEQQRIQSFQSHAKAAELAVYAALDHSRSVH